MSLNTLAESPHASERLLALVRALEHLDFSSDRFGNVTLEHRISGSKLIFTTAGDIQVHAAQDVDQKSGRWVHVNSDVQKIQKQLGRVLYGAHGEVLRTW